jgi:zinc finger CCHC domain-containing protein 9
MAGRHAHMTCFACRQVGHSASDCPTIREGSTSTKTNNGTTAVAVVGICYRCGSRKHSLARCRQPVQADNPLPYASCFVCSASGHLASSCPQNNGRGVYPDGGSCKLCGETTHLARDCTLRKIGRQSIFLFVVSSESLTKYFLLVFLFDKNVDE